MNPFTNSNDLRQDLTPHQHVNLYNNNIICQDVMQLLSYLHSEYFKKRCYNYLKTIKFVSLQLLLFKAFDISLCLSFPSFFSMTSNYRIRSFFKAIIKKIKVGWCCFECLAQKVRCHSEGPIKGRCVWPKLALEIVVKKSYKETDIRTRLLGFFNRNSKAIWIL